MQLYYAPGTVAGAVVIALKATDLPHELTTINFAEAAQRSPEFLAVNPKGRVPALVTSQGVLTETGAILDFIAASAPEAGLLPEDPFAAAQVRATSHYLASTMHVNHAHSRRGARWADDPKSHADMAAKVPETMAASCAYIEGEIVGPYLFGAQMTLADCHLYTVCTWLRGDGVDPTDFPKLTRFMETMRAHPAVEAAYACGALKDSR